MIVTETRPEDRFVEAFRIHEGHALNGTNAHLQALRQQALERFAALGFPDRKREAWKYTRVERLLRRDYRLLLGPHETRLTPADLAPYLIPGLDAHLAVFVNGRFHEGLSRPGELPPGVVLGGLRRAAEVHGSLVDPHLARYADFRSEVFTALNTAFTQDGLFLYVPKGTVVEKPVHVLSLAEADTPALLQPRRLVVAERGSQVRVVVSEHAPTGAPLFTNAVTEVYVGAGAHVDQYTLQHEGPHASRVATVQACQQADSVFRTSTFTFSGELVRNNVSVLPDGTGCSSYLYGLVMARGEMHVDNHTLVDHARPQCFSNELYKNILDGQATGVFNGRVLVRPDAQQTNAYQSNKSILLDPRAQMYTKPELEIYADDVKCSHGATTGQLDREGLFYLRSRGLTEGQARALLLVAFARDVVDSVEVAPLRDRRDALKTQRFKAS
jgi:Fe-S cluster assembly protein SufD